MGGFFDDVAGSIAGRVKNELTNKASNEITKGAENTVKGALSKEAAPKKPEKCPKCSSKLEPDAKFCPNCGYRLVVECKKCGVDYPVNTKFCKQCGEALK